MKLILTFIMLSLFISTAIANNINKDDVFKCKNGILPQSALTRTIKSKQTVADDGIISQESYSRLVDTKDKCFKINASELVYLIDNDQAVYKVYTDDYVNPWIMVDFNKSPAPHKRFNGVVKGVGKYTYKDGKGLPRSIPYMIAVK